MGVTIDEFNPAGLRGRVFGKLKDTDEDQIKELRKDKTI